MNVIGCHPPGNIFPGDPKWTATDKQTALEGIKYCRDHHLIPGLGRAASRKKILAIGGKALTALTGKKGILTWRGSPLPMEGGEVPRVMPIIHPSALMRQAKFTSATVSDLRKGLTLPPENYNLFPSIGDVGRFKSRTFAFDLEWDRAGNITVCGLSDRFFFAMVVPWREPFLSELERIFRSAETLIGHNIIGADLPYLERLGWLSPTVNIEDTMLKQHLCQPDYPHGLDFVASVFTSKVFWKGKGWEELDEASDPEVAVGQQWRTWDRADALPRIAGGYGGCLSAQEAFALYNARDTDAEFQINTPLDSMIGKWGMRDLYEHVSRPAGYICRSMSDRGLRIDTSHLGEIRKSIDCKIVELEARLPEGLAPYEEEVGCNLPAPEGTWKTKTKICKGTRKAPHDPVTFNFYFPTDNPTPCSSCGRPFTPGKMELAKIIKGRRMERVVPYNSTVRVSNYVASLGAKEIIDRKTGNKTTGKKARGVWAKEHPEFTLLGALKQQTTLRSNFAKDSLLNMERMFFNLKVHGTSEGRLSSTGRRKGIDLNIQNQPEAFRVIYIPEREDWGFINIDISQGESWLTCWLAEDWERWEKLQDPDYDEHSELASAIFNTPVSKALAKKDPLINALRQIGKKTNHASAYGMGPKQYLENLLSEGYDTYTEKDAREFLSTWKKINVKTVEWQRRTVQLVERQGFLRNPFGRIRWFSSYKSSTECLAFLPASCLADMVLRMMIAHFPVEYPESMEKNKTPVHHPLVEDWLMSIQVHDSLVLQGPWDTREEQIERSTRIMTQPWEQLNNFAFRVDVKSSRKSWGDC